MMVNGSGTRRDLWWIALLGLAAALIPRLLQRPGPAHPDSVQYLYQVTHGGSHFHLVFRHVALAPLRAASLVTRDPFTMSLIHGLLVTALGVAVMLLVVVALRLRASEAVCVMLLHASDPAILAFGTWEPLNDTVFALATAAAVAAYVLWSRGRCHPALAGLAMAALLGTRMTGAFVIIALLCLRPWRARGWVEAVRLFTWAAGLSVVYFLAVGVIFGDGPLWALRALDQLSEIQANAPEKRREGGTHLALLVRRPRFLVLAIIGIWLVATRRARRLLPFIATAGFLLVGLELLDAYSKDLLIRARRIAPAAMLMFPALAVFLRRTVGRAGAIAITAIFLAGSTWVACIEGRIDLAEPGWLSGYRNAPELEWQLAAVVASAAVGFALRKPVVFAVLLVPAVVINDAAVLNYRRDYIRMQSNWYEAMDLPSRQCPVAVVRPGDKMAQTAALWNELVNPCGRTVRAIRPKRVKLPPGDRVAFSRSTKLPGFRRTRSYFKRRKRVYRFDRKR